MSRISFGMEIFGDKSSIVLRQLQGVDNSREKERIKKTLARLMQEELTDRQREVVTMYFFEGKSLTEIGEILSLNKSTVSRHITRSKEKLKNALQYGLFPLWYD